MAVEKTNIYFPERNLTNLGLNIDYNRVADDRSAIEINTGTSPATIIIKQGSIIEVNGNRYIITDSDYSFQMDNASHRYITFTDNPNPLFSSASILGTFIPEKQGFYQADNVTRTLKYFIDQTNGNYDRSYYQYDRIKIMLSANNTITANTKLKFDTVVFDKFNQFDTANYQYEVPEDGYYIIDFKGNINLDSRADLMRNASVLCYTYAAYYATLICELIQYLDAGDVLYIRATRLTSSGTVVYGAKESLTHFSIERI